jgi:ribonuclease/clavin/mitogillin
LENIVTLTHRSTHCFLVDLAHGKLMVDAGWPGSLPALKSQLRGYRIEPPEIKFVLITHTHPDHAGLAQEVRRLTGARLILHEKQLPFLPQLEASFKNKGGYVPIVVEPGDVVLTASNRALLERLGIHGEVVETPGHSDDSVSLVLDSGSCFVGDLHLPQYAADEAAEALSRASWQKLLEHGAKTFYPAHAGPFAASAVEQALSESG